MTFFAAAHGASMEVGSLPGAGGMGKGELEDLWGTSLDQIWYLGPKVLMSFLHSWWFVPIAATSLCEQGLAFVIRCHEWRVLNRAFFCGCCSYNRGKYSPGTYLLTFSMEVACFNLHLRYNHMQRLLFSVLTVETRPLSKGGKPPLCLWKILSELFLKAAWFSLNVYCIITWSDSLDTSSPWQQTTSSAQYCISDLNIGYKGGSRLVYLYMYLCT